MDNQAHHEATGMTHSIISQCGVTNCMFNKQHECKAGSIQVAFVNGMAHCATYTPQDAPMGMGSTDVPQGIGQRTGEYE